MTENKTPRKLIWLLDDEVELSLTIQHACEDQFNIQLYHDPIKLLSDFETKPRPEVVVTDINLPMWDGFSVMKRLKHSGYKGEVIFISGDAKRDLVAKAMEQDAYSILEKPFSLQQFKTIVHEALNQSTKKLIRLQNVEASQMSFTEKKAQQIKDILMVLQQRNMEDRKFLHDLAPPIMILNHVIRALFVENPLPASAMPATPDMQKRKNLERALASLEQIKTLHADRKVQISHREHEDKLSQAV